METVAVCMSTYNGEKYIREQLDSIIQQSYNNILVFVRDDGSSDSTRQIIEEYCERYDNVIFIEKDSFENIGVKKSFLYLVKYAFEYLPEIKYFMFADQDDVWFANKVEKAVEKVEEAAISKTGRLYYSNKVIVDEKLNVRYDENIEYFDDYFDCLFTSLAFGCTMAFDRVFAVILCRYTPQIDCYHDSWIYRLAKTIGTTIIFDPDRYMFYRQHGNNQVGIHKKKNFSYYWKTFKAVIGKKDHFLQNQLSEIVKAYPQECQSSPNYVYVKKVINYNRGLKTKFRALRIKGIEKRRIVVRFSWYYKVLFELI